MKNQGCPVVSFDIGCKRSVATQEFYHKVFGWQMSPAQHSMKVDTQSPKGIPGSITSLGHEPHQYVMIHVEVESVKSAIGEVESHGGQNHIGPLPTGTGKFFAWVKDPEGNLLGLISDKE